MSSFIIIVSQKIVETLKLCQYNFIFSYIIIPLGINKTQLLMKLCFIYLPIHLKIILALAQENL